MASSVARAVASIAAAPPDRSKVTSVTATPWPRSSARYRASRSRPRCARTSSASSRRQGRSTFPAIAARSRLVRKEHARCAARSDAEYTTSPSARRCVRDPFRNGPFQGRHCTGKHAESVGRGAFGRLRLGQGREIELSDGELASTSRVGPPIRLAFSALELSAVPSWHSMGLHFSEPRRTHRARVGPSLYLALRSNNSGFIVSLDQSGGVRGDEHGTGPKTKRQFDR